MVDIKNLGESYFETQDNNKEKHNKFKNEIDKKILEAEKDINKKLTNANKQAELIISEAYEDSKKIFENAKKEGYEEGFSKGQDEGRVKADKVIQEALEIKQNLIKTKKEMARKLEHQIVELVIDSVEKILSKKLDEEEDTILGLIKQGLDKCTYTDSLILRVSPQDYDYVVEVKDKILSLAENIEDITIKKDGSLKKGACILDTVSGSIDSSIKTQLDNIKKLFKELLGNE